MKMCKSSCWAMFQRCLVGCKTSCVMLKCICRRSQFTLNFNRFHGIVHYMYCIPHYLFLSSVYYVSITFCVQFVFFALPYYYYGQYVCPDNYGLFFSLLGYNIFGLQHNPNPTVLNLRLPGIGSHQSVNARGRPTTCRTFNIDHHSTWLCQKFVAITEVGEDSLTNCYRGSNTWQEAHGLVPRLLHPLSPINRACWF